METNKESEKVKDPEHRLERGTAFGKAQIKLTCSSCGFNFVHLKSIVCDESGNDVLTYDCEGCNAITSITIVEYKGEIGILIETKSLPKSLPFIRNDHC